MKLTDLQNKHVAILGLGIEGVALCEYFLTHGITFSVFDEKSEDELTNVGKEWVKILSKLRKKHIPTVFGQIPTAQEMREFAVVVRSPGVSLHKEYLKGYRGDITSQTKLFFDNCPGKIVGVTGTKGKGTTSTLIYEMLKKAGKDAYLGGNIGLPPISFLDTLTAQSIVVLEMSSFQLEDLSKSPQVAVMLMVTQEHLDAYGNQNSHKDIKDYVDAKRNILRFQTTDDMAILNMDYTATRESAEIASAQIAWVSRYKPVGNGCFVENNAVVIRSGGQETGIIDVKDILLPGAHNLENICAASMAAFFLGVSIADIAFVIKTFKGLEHRLELVKTIKGVRYYDDSFSTVPETAIAAILAFQDPEILILGGSSKNSNFTELGHVIEQMTNIKAIIGIGVEWERIKAHIDFRKTKTKVVEGLKDMKSIVKECSKLAAPGDVVLLSPACASFGMFENYKDRGNQFKKYVKEL